MCYRFKSYHIYKIYIEIERKKKFKKNLIVRHYFSKTNKKFHCSDHLYCIQWFSWLEWTNSISNSTCWRIWWTQICSIRWYGKGSSWSFCWALHSGRMHLLLQNTTPQNLFWESCLDQSPVIKLTKSSEITYLALHCSFMYDQACINSNKTTTHDNKFKLLLWF